MSKQKSIRNESKRMLGYAGKLITMLPGQTYMLNDAQVAALRIDPCFPHDVARGDVVDCDGILVDAKPAPAPAPKSAISTALRALNAEATNVTTPVPVRK